MINIRIALLFLAIIGGAQNIMAHGGGESGAYAKFERTTYPEVDYSNVSDKDLVKRGEYLSKAGDCIACHTNNEQGSAKYSGGLPVNTPFGTFYSPNITPDVKTGIGAWTRKDFINALRRGVNPHGQHYFPVFPYLYYNKLPVSDLDALYAYFKAIPAVKQPNIPHDIMFPFNIRFAQIGWKLMFFYPYRGEWKPNLDQDIELKRGEYLVETLGHCAMCHSPLNPLGGEIRSKHLAGGMVDGYYVPPINEKSLSKASVEKVMRVFTHNERTGGTKVKGPMLEVNYDSLQHLTHEDLQAIAKYLKSVPAPKSEEVSVDKNDKVGKAKSIYKSYCSACHTTGASGAPMLRDEKAWQPYLEKGMEVVYNNAINGIGSMPAMGACTDCDKQDIKDTIDYMVSIVSGKGITNDKMRKLGDKPPEISMVDAAKLYDENCASCHNPEMPGDAIKIDNSRAWRELLAQKDVVDVFGYIIKGARGNNEHVAGEKLNDAELIGAVKYLLSALPEKDLQLW